MGTNLMQATLNGQIVRELPAERIELDYPGLTARGEVCMGRTRKGDIWAAIGFNTGAGGAGGHTNPERLFHSADDGRTWTSRPMEPTGEQRMCAFTVLVCMTLNPQRVFDT